TATPRHAQEADVANRNRSSLRGEVYRRLAESGSGFYTDAEINQWLNDGVRDVSMTIEPLMTSTTTTTVESTREYQLPNDTISVRKALYLGTNDSWAELEATTWEDLFDEDP